MIWNNKEEIETTCSTVKQWRQINVLQINMKFKAGGLQLNKLLVSNLKYYLFFFSLISGFKISRVLLWETWNTFLLLKCCTAAAVQYPSSRGDTVQSVPCAVIRLLLTLFPLMNAKKLVCGEAVFSCDGLLGCQNVFSSPGTEWLRNTPLSVYGCLYYLSPFSLV
jgi:hypothetical protein